MGAGLVYGATLFCTDSQPPNSSWCFSSPADTNSCFRAAFLYGTPWGDTELGGAKTPRFVIADGAAAEPRCPHLPLVVSNPRAPLFSQQSSADPYCQEGNISHCSQHRVPTQCSPSSAPHLAAAPLPLLHIHVPFVPAMLGFGL